MADENKILVRLNVDAENGTAAIKNFKGQVIKAAVPVEDLNRVLAENNLELSRTTSGIGRQMAALKKQRGNLQINSREFQNHTKALRFYQSQLDMSAGATGSASSAAMELGRVVSDMPYGIRGVANNLSQFASQMAYATKQTGSFRLAVQDMWKALMGPLGILLAIQSVIAALDHFSQKKKKAKEASEEFEKALKKEIEVLRGYESIAGNVNSSLEEREGAVLAAAAANKDYAKSILEGNKTLTSQEQAVKALLMEERSLLEVKEKLKRVQEINNTTLKDENRSIEEVEASISKLKDKYNELKGNVQQGGAALWEYYHGKEGIITSEQAVIDKLKERKKVLEELVDDIETSTVTERGSEAWLKQTIADLEKIRSKTADTSKEYRDQTTSITVLRKQLAELRGDQEKETSGGKPKKLSPFKTPEELEIDIKNSERAQIRLQKRIQDARLKKELNDRLSEVTSEDDKRKIREEYQVKRLKNQLDTEQAILDLKIDTEKAVVKTKTQNHIDDLKKAQELFEYKMDLEAEAGNITKAQRDELVKNSKGKLYGAIIQAEEESQISLSQITSKYAPVLAFLETFKKAEMDALTSGFGAKDSKKESGLTEMEKFAEQFNAISSSVTSFMNGEFDRQMTIEQNKTNALNNELRERLNNENLSADERKNIQLKIARNDEALRKKQEKIEKKRFRMNKAAQIAGALVNTAAAAAGVMAQAKGGFFSRLAEAIPTIAFGLGQVAIIARQKFQSSAGATIPAGALGSGGGSGGGRGDRSFDFNLAGASRENQLAQTLQGRFDQPLQAYVVARDITNQQQLDEDIRSNASFG